MCATRGEGHRRECDSPGAARYGRSMTGAIIVVGSINTDIVVRAPRHPHPGETLIGSGVAEYPGGKGANQAVAAARAGGQVRMIGRVGGDDRGTQLRNGLAADDVDVTHVGTCKHDPTGLAMITVDDAGENTIIVVSGANHKIRSVHVDDAVGAGVFSGGSVLLAQLECPLEVVTNSLRAARAAGLRTVLNAAPAQRLDDDVLSSVDVLIVNEHELAIVTGCADPGDAMRAAQRLVPTVVLTLGAKGSMFVDAATGDSPVAVNAFAVVAVDTTAAGDAFCGAFVVGLAANLSTEEAVRRGNAAGALAATKAGAQPSLPTAADIDALISPTHRSH